MPKRVLIPFRHSHRLAPYLDAVRAGGMEPVPADVSEPIAIENTDGLLLMGGTDINPARYLAQPWPETEAPDDKRDLAELEVLDEALNKGMPVLAICRGLQLLNVYYGGTLIQHLSSAGRHDTEFEDKATVAHEISIEKDSLLGAIAQAPVWRVNSRHHQAADRIGAGLRVVARDAQDETIEALERPESRFVLGVQWHPENQVFQYPEQLQLFNRFCQEL